MLSDVTFELTLPIKITSKGISKEEINQDIVEEIKSTGNEKSEKHEKSKEIQKRNLRIKAKKVKRV